MRAQSATLFWFRRPWRERGGFRGSRAQRPKYRRQQRQYDHCGNHPVDALTNIGHDRTEEVAAEDHAPHPKASAEEVIRKISGVGHLGGSGDRWTKGPDDGHE